MTHIFVVRVSMERRKNMKMRTRIILIISVCVLAFTLCSCSKKNPATTDSFQTKMKEAGYTVTDATDQIAGAKDFKSVYLAYKGDVQFEFYVCTSNDVAKERFTAVQKIFEKTRTSGNTETTENVSNHSKYTLNNGTKYMVISRIDNTCVYVVADEGLTSKIKDVLAVIGY